MAITQSGIASEDYGDYLASLMASGYQGTGTLNQEQGQILQSYQQETLAKVVQGGAPTATADFGNPNDPLVTGLTTDPTLAGVGLGAGAGVLGTLAGGIAALPTLASVFAALGIPGAGTLATIAGVAGAGYAALQALGLGEGGGILGNNLLGGDNSVVNGVTVGGPGLPEPTGNWVILNEWPIGNNKRGYYTVSQLTGKRMFGIVDLRTKVWKFWRAPKPRLAIIGKNMPKHRMIVRLRKNLSKHRADADTILRLTSPKYSAYKRRSRRH